MSVSKRQIKAATGTRLSCRGWHQEAALRMLMNNLDTNVAEKPDELIIYGGRGKAARNWDCFDAIIKSLRALEIDETLLVQSGKPVGIFKSHPDAPRVLIANSNIVPAWATQENFDAWEKAVPNEKKDVVKEIKKLAQKAEEIYLATDPDREGESISWHLLEAAQIDPDRARLVVFHEITEPAIKEAFANPRHINTDLVDAQQARRILDRLVGYSISPILWEKVRSRLSAGRVQVSVALRLIVEREREIENFVPVEYWSIHAELQPEGLKSTFVAKLARIDDMDLELPNEETVKPILTDMETAAYTITRIKRGERLKEKNYCP